MERFTCQFQEWYQSTVFQINPQGLSFSLIFSFFVFLHFIFVVIIFMLLRFVSVGKGAVQMFIIHTLRVHYAHAAANLNLGYSKYAKVALVHYFCTIALRTSRAVVTRA